MGNRLDYLDSVVIPNFALYSEDITQTSAWAKTNGAIVPNSASWIVTGTDIADELEKAVGDATVSMRQRIYTPLDDVIPYTYSVYAKTAGCPFIVLSLVNKVGIPLLTFFDLTTGVIGLDGHAVSGIQAAGDGWYRCWVGFGMGVGASTPNITLTLAQANAVPLVGGLAVGNGVLLCGAQLNAGLAPLDYIKTEAEIANYRMILTVGGLLPDSQVGRTLTVSGGSSYTVTDNKDDWCDVEEDASGETPGSLVTIIEPEPTGGDTVALITRLKTKPTGRAIFSDINSDFDVDQDGVLVILEDENAIHDELKNLITTGFAERVMYPNWGVDLDSFLGDPVSQERAHFLGMEIDRIISAEEPRVFIIRLDVKPKPDDQAYDIVMEHKIDLLFIKSLFAKRLSVEE